MIPDSNACTEISDERKAETEMCSEQLRMEEVRFQKSWQPKV